MMRKSNKPLDMGLLENLRFKIGTAKDFYEVFNYFFDNFGENSDFMDQGEPADDKLLLALLKAIGQAVLQTQTVKLDKVMLMRVPEYNFIHGGLMINNALANVIYCDDLQTGIAAFCLPSAGGKTQLTRFSAEMLPPNMVDELTNLQH